MNARSHIGVQAGIAADFGLWTLISWAAGWHGWMIAIPAAALLITALPAAILGAWLANGRKPI
jgi:hypothetical protein